jgi:hypothetical protein
MKRILRHLIIACAGTSFFLGGCGRMQDPDSRLANADEGSKPVQLIVFGGNRSCKPDRNDRRTPLLMDMAAKIVDVLAKLRSAGRQTDVLASCFLDYDKLRFTRDVEAGENGRDEDIGVEELIARTGESATGQSRLFLLGHSYGGWMAMKLAKDLAGRVEIDGLITVDPISRLRCTYTTWDDCFSAPTDIVPEERQRIKTGTKQWLNFYQTQTPYLHSGTIDEADENQELESTHFRIDTHEEVWTRLEQWF